MCWNLRDGLRDCLVAAAPYGGPIGQRSPSSRPQLEIYSASGNSLASFPWKSGPVVQLGWTVNDELLCIQEDGTVLIYDLFGSFKRHFSMGQEVVQSQVLEAKVFHSPYGTGVAIVTGSSRFTLATNIDDLKLRRLPEVPGLQGAPSCWAVLTQDRQTKVLLANGADLFILDNTSCTAVVRHTHTHTRTHTHAHTRTHTHTHTHTHSHTQQPSVVLMWDRLLLVAGVCNDIIQFPVEEQCVCVGELDGVRVVSSSRQELLQEVPLVCQEIFKIASMAPGALLLEAHREYEKCSQKADEYLREIKEQSMLGEAVRQCVEAAGHEYDIQTQKTLLRAASFGKCFLTDFSPDSFVATCRELRVLNAVREAGVGLPLTHSQFKQMTVQVLIDRLVYRQFYPLAIEICRYLKTPDYQGVSRVLKHWASCKVQQKDLSDEAIARAVCLKVGDSAGVSYSHIAAKAYECGRTELAIKLLDYEARSGEQVPLLLKMKRSQLALSKAVESGDTDLVYTVVTYLKNEMNRGDFFMTLRNQPVALSLYRQFCKLQEQDTLKDLYNQDDDHQELANYYVTASYREKRLESRLSVLQSAVDEYNKAKNEFAAKATEDEMRLLRFQRKLDDEKGAGLLGLSLQATMEALLALGLHKQAEQLYRDFRVPDKRYWWLKLKSLAEKEEWEELEKFSKSKKSPIGYLPFVEVCMKRHNKHEAKKYVSKVPPEQKVKAHLGPGGCGRCGDREAERGRDGAVLARCSASDRLLIDKLNRARATATKK
uniref:Vacuolar protein sorting-associated protein 16 homolog n=1 Tax=Myripristis murdjan TaxID=586833 RepID=A0A667ZAU1_9TELE